MTKAILTIKSVRTLDGESEVTEVITEGGYAFSDGECVMTYNETEATGYENSVTTIRAVHDVRFEMVRSGEVSSELYAEPGKKNYSRYGTPYFDVTMGIAAKSVKADISENGGHITAEYSMDINSEFMGDYILEVTAKTI